MSEVEAKKQLRISARAARASQTDEERRTRSDRAVERLLALPELGGSGGTVLLYAVHGDEVDPTGASLSLRDRGWRLLYPRVTGDSIEAAVGGDQRDLSIGFRGILEPTGPVVDPGHIDVAVIPGVAFDRRGGRLGQGAGHYDRLLGRLRPDCLRVGFAFACQMAAHVPTEAHDEAVDVVITEAATHRIVPIAPGPA